MKQELQRNPSSLRTGLAAAVLVALVASYPAASAQAQDQQPTPTQMVDAINGVFGKQSYGRAIHAKGIVLEGSFLPDREATVLTRAAHFKGGRVPVLVRFSSFAGIPTIADTDGLASPRGMAIKFQPGTGNETDIVTHSYDGFPVATSAEFETLLQALKSSGPDTPAPTPLEKFFTSHPIAKTFLTTQSPPPTSFATMRYYGVNSFQFSNAAGRSQFGRYQLVPAAGEHSLSKQQLAGAGKDYLEQEIGRRIAGAPVRFILQVQLAQDGDRIDDPSVAWPKTRRVVKLGELTIDRVLADSEAAERRLMFTPTAVADGIEAADPMIAMRGAAYGISYGRRHAP
jgi:catalase